MDKSRCCSLESAVLFGACAFTLDTLLKLWDLTFSVVLIGFNWDKYGNLVVRSHVVSAFFASVYCTFSIILAFFLFKGIFRKLPGVIKLGAIFVLVLRLWECAGSLVSWDDSTLGISGGSPAIRDEFGVHRAAKIARFIVLNLAAAIFVGLLFVYYRSLLPPRQYEQRYRNHHHSKGGGDSKIIRNSSSTLSI